jgi:hypothetical protein
MAALSVEEVRAAEADALYGMNWRTASRLAHPPRGQDAQEARTRLNADQRDRVDLPPDEVERRKAFYRSLNKLKHAALCCSAQGILYAIEEEARVEVAAKSKIRNRLSATSLL